MPALKVNGLLVACIFLFACNHSSNPGCESDNQCRQGRVCIDSACASINAADVDCEDFTTQSLRGEILNTEGGCELELDALEFKGCRTLCQPSIPCLGQTISYECHEANLDQPRACSCQTTFGAITLARFEYTENSCTDVAKIKDDIELYCRILLKPENISLAE